MPRLFLNPKRRIFKPLDKSGIILLITHNPHLGSRHIPKSADRHDIQIIEQHPLRCALRGCCRYVSFRYTLIMEYTQILVLTYTERFMVVPIDYGLLEQLIHFSVCTPSINENINACKIAITLICCHSDGKTKFLGSPHSFFGGVFEH